MGEKQAMAQGVRIARQLMDKMAAVGYRLSAALRRRQVGTGVVRHLSMSCRTVYGQVLHLGNPTLRA